MSSQQVLKDRQGFRCLGVAGISLQLFCGLRIRRCASLRHLLLFNYISIRITEDRNSIFGQMAVTLGKRKRRAEVVSESPARKARDTESEDDDTARALFQRAFEARFKPLEKRESPLSDDEDDEEDIASEDDDVESDWSGLSGDEDAVEVVEHSQPNYVSDEVDGGKKRFMVSERFHRITSGSC